VQELVDAACTVMLLCTQVDASCPVIGLAVEAATNSERNKPPSRDKCPTEIRVGSGPCNQKSLDLAE
jgi:hypothetical protein